jgi:hypothetical protein
MDYRPTIGLLLSVDLVIAVARLSMIRVRSPLIFPLIKFKQSNPERRRML